MPADINDDIEAEEEETNQTKPLHSMDSFCVIESIIDDLLNGMSFYDNESETSFNISVESSVVSQLQCHHCLGHIEDLSNVKVVCHACQIQHPTNNTKVEVEKNVVAKIAQEVKLFDFKPTLHNGRLLMYAPTTKDPKQFLEVKSILFRDFNAT